MTDRNRRIKTLARRRRGAARRARRGVLLLIVLSVLVMFMLVGAAFVLVGSQSLSANKAAEKSNVAAPQQGDLLERAVRQLLRDTHNAHSVARYHSLLRDAYGADGFVAKTLPYAGVPVALQNAFPTYAGADATDLIGPAGGQLIDLYIVDRNAAVEAPPIVTPEFVAQLDTDLNGLPVDKTLERTNGYYNGCVLTILTGAAKGQSTRVLDYQHLGDLTPADPSDDGQFRLRVLAFPRSDGGALQLPLDASNDLADVQFMVNGRPFNGSGVGLNVMSAPTGPRLTAYEAVRNASGGYVEPDTGAFVGGPLALLPNPRYYTPAYTTAVGAQTYNLFQVDETTGIASGYLASNPTVDPLTAGGSLALYDTFTGPGGADESYDAPDYQNMLLASSPLRPRARGRLISPAAGGGTGGGFTPPPAPGPNETVMEIAQYYASGPNQAPKRLDLDDLPIPSLHRPALVNYWLHRLAQAPWLVAAIDDPERRVKAILQPYGADARPGGAGVNQDNAAPPIAAQIVAFKRKYILRPLIEDHPEFTGSNPQVEQLSQWIAASNSFINGGLITFPTLEVAGPWDVDNNGDGIPDSIWVDLGMPVQETEDGRLYKPLFAILVQDMDGRLNLNAHGSTDHFTAALTDGIFLPGKRMDFSTGTNHVNLANGVAAPSALTGLTSSDQLPPGSGYGPADVSLRSVLSPQVPVISATWAAPSSPPVWMQPDTFGNPPPIGDPTRDDYKRLLGGRPPAVAAATADAIRQPVLWGRYGTVMSGSPNITASPGIPFFEQNLFPTTIDPLADVEMQGYPAYSRHASDFMLRGGSAVGTMRLNTLGNGFASGFGSMPDLRSAFSTSLDYAGAVIHEAESEAYLRRTTLASGINFSYFTPLLPDSPYELNLMERSRRDSTPDLSSVVASYGSTGAINDDAPFSPGELERLLRAYDADAGRLPDRLWMLVDAFDPDKLVVQTTHANTGTLPNAAYQPSPGEQLVAQIEAATRRNAVTTESFDIPSTNENWTARLLYGADGKVGLPFDESDDDQPLVNPADVADPATLLENGVDDYVVVMRELPPKNARLIDYLRYRIVLELKRQHASRYPAAMLASHPTLVLAVNRILHGDNTLTSTQVRNDLYSFGGLLAPEVIAGRKMDLNRPFGDGKDNNGNGVVDEPTEAGEAWVDANNNGLFESDFFIESDGLSGFYGDTNNNGSVTPADWINRGRDYNRDNTPDPEPLTDNLWHSQLAQPVPFDHVNGQDANGRGTFTAGGERIRDDAQMARQLYARHLYCLALLMADENYLTPYDANDPQVVDYLDPEAEPDPLFQKEGSPAWQIAQALAGDTDPAEPHATPTPIQRAEAVRMARRKLTCRRLAQWAINCADMRDPDAIMTPFEYDENPYDGWNTTNLTDAANPVVYPLDGDVGTNENLGNYVVVESGGLNPEDGPVIPANLQTRGVVWGAERPELLITETFAFHDRRVEDNHGLLFSDGSTIEGGEFDPGDLYENQSVTQDGNLPPDTTLDQRLRPLGGAFVELYNPWSLDGQLPAELYGGRDLDNDDNDNDPRTGTPDTLLGVDLARLSAVEVDGRRSPVWRMIAVEEHPQLRNDDVRDDTGRSDALDPQGIYRDYLPHKYEHFDEKANSLMDALSDRRVEEPTLNRARVPDPDFPTFPGVSTQPRYTRVTDHPYLENNAWTEATIPHPPRTAGQYTIQGVPASVTRLQFLAPRHYVERAFYFTSADGTPDLSPQEPAVRIPLPYRAVPLNRLPNAWQGAVAQAGRLRQLRDTYLWPNGMMVDTDANELRIYNHHFIAKHKDLYVDPDEPERDAVIAPVVPGRYCVVGTSGFSYARYNPVTGVANKKYPGRLITPLGRRLPNALDGSGADELGEDYDRRQSITGEGDDTNNKGTRRIELIPSPDPEAHQVLVGDNGGNESFLIDDNNDGTHEVNVTRQFSTAAVLNDIDPSTGERSGLVPPSSANYRIKPAVAVPVKGMSLSEPVDNYLLRWMELEPDTIVRDWRPEMAEGEGQWIDRREANRQGNFGINEDIQPLPFDEPLDLERPLVENHTTPNYRTVHLQRLANPLLPWNPPPDPDDPNDPHVPTLPVNPYLTIDGSSVDLTAFNGADDAEQTALGDSPDKPRSGGRHSDSAQPSYPYELHEWNAPLPDTADVLQVDRIKMTLASQQRGLHAVNQPAAQAAPARLIFQQEPINLIQEEYGVMQLREPHAARKTAYRNQAMLDGSLRPPRHVMDFPIFHSLGFMNQPVLRGQMVGQFGAGSPAPPPNFYTQSSGDFSATFNQIDANGDGIQGDLIGAPFTDLTDSGDKSDRNDDTFAAMHWGNRPYASALEILQVPATSSGLLTREFSTFNPNLGALTFPLDPAVRLQSNPYNGNINDDYVGPSANPIEASEKANIGRYRNERGQFGHLMNLFNSADAPATLQPITDNQQVAVEASGSANLSRLTGYLGVPSRFVATHLTLNPTLFNTSSTQGAPLDPRSDLLAPFNTVDKYREPGRVNLNTVVGMSDNSAAGAGGVLSYWSPVYDGLMHRLNDNNLFSSSGQLIQVGHRGPAWRDVAISRRGYHDPAIPDLRNDGSEMSLHPAVPTFFANPFREAEESTLVPLLSLARSKSEATLLRSHPFSPGPDGAWGAAAQDDNQQDVPPNGLRDDAGEAGAGDDDDLFTNGLAENYLTPGGGGAFVEKTRVPLFSGGTTEPALNSHRNAALRYMPMTRMSSMATTRSGVYAIWITVGFFEVKPAPDWNHATNFPSDPNGAAKQGAVRAAFSNDRELYDRVYPDGYQLGKELGSDTGDTHRHRGFWIVDRTTPVGFRPGEDVNVERMILLQRRIE